MDILTAWYKFWGRVWVPPHLRHMTEPVILHLSDTPVPFFSALPSLLRHVNPTWIIHTGDLVDDVKLGLNASHMTYYNSQVRRLIRILEASEAEAVYLCLGNHDDLKTVTRESRRIEIIPSFEQLAMEGLTLGVAHYAAKAMAAGGDICLFGHDLETKTDLYGFPRLLNGLEAIHVILPRSGRIFHLPYPTGTDDQRLGRGKVGL